MGVEQPQTWEEWHDWARELCSTHDAVRVQQSLADMGVQVTQLHRMRELLRRAELVSVNDGCNVPGYTGSIVMRFPGDDWPGLLGWSFDSASDETHSPTEKDRT